MKNKFEKFKEEEKSVSADSNKIQKVSPKPLPNPEVSETPVDNSGKSQARVFPGDKSRDACCKMLLRILEDGLRSHNLKKSEDELRAIVCEVEEGDHTFFGFNLRRFRTFPVEQIEGGRKIQGRRSNSLFESEGAFHCQPF